MTLAYSYQAPAGYAQNPDIAGNFARGFQGVRSVTDELGAEQTLADLARSIGGQQQQPAAAPNAQPQSLSDLMQSGNPGNQMIAGSAQAATSATDPTLASYFKTLASRESSNNPNATNPASSAGGLYQITDPTWQALVAQNPNSGLTADGKMDPAQQQTAVRLLTKQNAQALTQSGQPVNPATLYAAHLLGAPTATKLLGYADDTPVASVVPAEDVQANPHLADMTVGQFKSWAGQSGTSPQGGYAPPLAGQPMDPGLPSRDVLTALLQNPVTRELGTTLLSRQIDPSYQLDIQGKVADNALKTAEAQAWSGGFGKPPVGYMRSPDGTGLVPIPGGPANPGSTADGTPLGTTGQPIIDPTADGYTSKPVAGGLTQAAIDQKALSYLTSGTLPPSGRGPAGAQAAAISNRMAEMDAGGNLTANKTQLKSLSSALTDQTKYLNNTERAFNTANDTLANLQTYMQKNGINPSQFPDYNSFTNFLKARGLDPGAAGGYNAQLATLRQEYSQVLAKGGVRSVETDREASQLIPDGLNPAQLAQVAAQIKIDSDNAINEARKQVGSVTAQINGLAKGNNPDAAPADTSAAAPAAAPGVPAGAVTKSIGGQNFYQDPQSGKWFHAD